MNASRIVHLSIAFAVSSAVLVLPDAEVRAEPPASMTKDQCIDAHSRGQTLRDTGKLSQARETFLKCAQSACPSLIQGDCARFADEASRMVPSVVFVARDAKGNDVVDTLVFVDDAQVADRLDQGKSFDIDPGEHTIRFLHRDKKVEQKIVVHQSERERIVTGTFPDAMNVDKPVGAPPASQAAEPPSSEPSKPNRALGPLLVMGGGTAVLITGGVLAFIGFNKVPSQCSYSQKQCAAPPGDSALGTAQSGARMVNIGFIVGGVGLAAIGGGIAWYFFRGPSEAPKKDSAFAPWFPDQRSAGVSWKGAF
ncbi:MAG TPA: hypothetical protein VNO21_08430 [Polyangiaceae bacterium]|nr:hypothetical protein [Polyangiaceae bacterium]